MASGVRRSSAVLAALALFAVSVVGPAAAPAYASALIFDLDIAAKSQSAEVAPTRLYVAPAGEDALTNPCTSIDTPCLTVSAAVTRAHTAISDGVVDVTVSIAAGTYTENVNIGAVEPGHSLGLAGAGASTTTLQGLGTASVVIITSGTVTIAGLTITGGNAVSGGGIFNDAGVLTVVDSTVSGNAATGNGRTTGGGGIYNNSGTVTVSGSTVSDNILTGPDTLAGGGGISNNSGTVTVSDSVVSDNEAARGYAGGIYNNAGTATVAGSTVSGNSGWYVGGIHNRGTLTVSRTTLSDNIATKVFGGGIANDGGTMAVSDSTLSGNTALNANTGKGGAIYNRGPATVTNATLLSNSAYQGGGIWTNKSMTVTNVTLSNNTHTQTLGGGIRPGGGIWAEGGTTTIADSILSASSCSITSAISDGGYNVSDSCTFQVANPTSIHGSTTIGLKPLAANGSTGPWTMAIDATSSAHHLVPGCTGTDARGLGRPGFGGSANCDAGAYELQGIAPTVTVDPLSQTVSTAAEAAFTAAATGTPDPTVQWQVNTGSAWADIPGATATELILTGVTHSMDGHQYRAAFTNGVAPDATSTAATLTVPAPPPVGNQNSDGRLPGSVSISVAAGGSATWSIGVPTPSAPVLPSVTSPNAGTITFTSSTVVAPRPRYTMIDEAFVITAPPASAAEPLRLRFQINDQSLPAGANPQALTVFRDGDAVAECATPNATTAAPDPCVAASGSTRGVTTVTVLSSHASTWTFGVPADRIAGTDRYATSALVAERFGTANAIVVANGAHAKQGLDALSANYLAGDVDAPVLLTQATAVSAGAVTAVKKVLRGASGPTIYVMGGTDSVSDAVADQIKAAAASVAAGPVSVLRVAGADRYATSVLAATAAGAISNAIRLTPTGTAQKTAILASGQVNADALAAGALSNAWRIPVLFTRDNALPASVRDVLVDEKITQLLVLGDTDRVSQAVLDQARAAGIASIRRIAGADRFATGAQLYTFAMNSMENASGDHYGAPGGATVYLANGLTGFPDAVSVASLAGRRGDVVLIVPSSTLPESTGGFLLRHRGALDDAIALGQRATIAQSLLDAANGLVS